MTEAQAPRRPTISIYQNPDHVAGILQQLFVAPLVTNEVREHGSDESSGDGTKTTKHGGVKAAGSVPLVGEVGLDLSGDRVKFAESGLSASAKTIQNFTYSQAYYLYLVRDTLRERDLLRTVAGAEDAANLASGDLVEFQATFEPNSLHALLDILTSDLIAAIVRHSVRSEMLSMFEAIDDFEKRRAYVEMMDMKANARAEIAKAAADAVRVDFRAEKTREFYGHVSDVTAITICDNQHFVLEDEDRILDGEFTVLGKVTSAVEPNVPVLSRNKLLDRLSPEVVDALFDTLRSSTAESAEKIDIGGQELDLGEVLDLAFPSRIEGPSFKVVPVAIYA